MGSLSRGTKADQFSYVPAGTVLPFAGDTAPTGWAICNGDPVSRTDYAELFTAIGELWGVGDGSTTFNLPDMRGQFLRGLDTTEGVDPDFATRIVGSSQVDEFKNHQHNTFYGGIGGGNQYPEDPYISNQLAGTAHAVSSSGGAETRPKNVAVNYIIKL